MIGCDTQGFGAVAIALEDMDRVFENAEDRVASATLKICLNQRPCKDSLSHLSSWLMSGRLAQVELHYVQAGSATLDTGSERLVAKPISAERLRGFITDTDWTQVNQRQGTFTLDNNDTKVNGSMTARPETVAPSYDDLATNLSECLTKIQKDEVTLSSNIAVLQSSIESLRVLMECQHQEPELPDESEDNDD